MEVGRAVKIENSFYRYFPSFQRIGIELLSFII